MRKLKFEVGDKPFFFDGRACTFEQVEVVEQLPDKDFPSSDGFKSIFTDSEGKTEIKFVYGFYLHSKVEAIERAKENIRFLNELIRKLEIGEF